MFVAHPPAQFLNSPPGQIQGVILIDCWADPDPRISSFYWELCQKLRVIGPKQVINASADLSLLGENNPWQEWKWDPSIRNTLRRFAWDNSNFCDDHGRREHWLPDSQAILMNLLRHCYRLKNTAEIFFHKSILGNDNSVALFTPRDFLYYWQHHCDEVEHWLVAGRSWRVCVHDRNLGLRQMRNLTRLTGGRLRFYVTDWSVLRNDREAISHEDIIQDDLTWTKTNLGYMLIGDHQA